MGKKRYKNNIPYSTVHMQETIQAAHQEFKSRPRKSKIEFHYVLLHQLRFFAAPAWLALAAALFVFYFVLQQFSLNCASFLAVRHIAFLFSIFAVGITLISIFFLDYAVKYNMLEIEAAARIPNAKLLLAKFIVIGAGNFCVLVILFFLSFTHFTMGAAAIFFYMVLPFLICNYGCVVIFNRIKTEYRKIACNIYSCLLLFIGFLINRKTGNTADQPFIWGVLTLVFTILLCYELRKLLKKYYTFDYLPQRL